MAIFNPDVPTGNDPNFMGYSRPISPYEGNKALGTLFQGIGNTIETVAKGADEVIKNIIDRKVNEGVDQIREPFVANLETQAGVADANRVTPPEILPTSSNTSTNVPMDITNGVRTAEGLSRSFAAGNLPSTYYTSRVNLLAKDLRSQYMGYREYIDNQISRASGVSAANGYMNELIQNISKDASANKTEKEKALTFAMSNLGVPGMQQAVADIESGKVANPLTYVSQKAAQYKSDEFDYNRRKMARDDIEGDNKLLVDQSKKDLVKVANDIYTQDFTAVDDSIRLHFGNKDIKGASMEDLGKLVLSAQRGEITGITDQDWQAVGQAFQGLITKTQQRIREKANEKGKNGSLAANTGTEFMDTTINNQTKHLTEIVKNIRDKDYGLAFSNYNTARAVIDDTAAGPNGLLTTNDPELFSLRQYARYGSVVNKYMGQTGFGEFIKTGLEADLPKDLKSLTNYQKQKLIAQDDPQTYSMKDAIQTLKKHDVGLPPKDNSPKDPNRLKSEYKVYEGIIDLPGQLLNPNLSDDGKYNVAMAAFSDKNIGMVSEIAQDRYVTNPATGEVTFIPGSHMTFNKMVTPAIINKMWELGLRKPELWGMFKNWSEKSWGNELFGQDIRDLNEFKTNPAFKFSFVDGDIPQWKVEYKPTPAGKNLYSMDTVNTAGEKITFDNIQRKVDLINSGLAQMAYLAKKENSDVGAYLLRIMIAQGLDPKGGTVSSELMDRLVNSRKPIIDPFKNANDSKDQSRVK